MNQEGTCKYIDPELRRKVCTEDIYLWYLHIFITVYNYLNEILNERFYKVRQRKDPKAHP